MNALSSAAYFACCTSIFYMNRNHSLPKPQSPHTCINSVATQAVQPQKSRLFIQLKRTPQTSWPGNTTSSPQLSCSARFCPSMTPNWAFQMQMHPPEETAFMETGNMIQQHCSVSSVSETHLPFVRSGHIEHLQALGHGSQLLHKGTGR